MMRILLSGLTMLVAAALNADPARAQATRTWVSGVGDDVNPCSRTAPCKTFAGAISKTATNGIINCIDPGGFGAVTITKSITIDCAEVTAGVLAAGTNGININGAGVVVRLRGLSIEGAGTGLIGVNFIQGAVLEIDQCRIFGYQSGTAAGVLFAPSAGGAEMYIADSYVSDNGTGATGGGIVFKPSAGGGGNISVNRTQVLNNSAGIIVDAGAATVANISGTIGNSVVAGNANNGITGVSTAGHPAVSVMVENVVVTFNVGVGINSNGATASGQGSVTVRVGRSTIDGNVTGVSATGSGILKSYGTNQLNGNGTDGAFQLPNLNQL